MGSKTERILLMLFLVLALVASSVEAKTITLYRIQLGAYNTQGEAEGKKTSAEAEGFSPVYIVQKDAETPWKVLVGDWAEYTQAKQQTQAWKAEGKNEGRGFVTQVELPEKDAIAQSLPTPPGAFDQAGSRFSSAADASKRSTAQFHVQIGNPGDLAEKERLRAILLAKGESDVYIAKQGESYALLLGNYAAANDAISEASRFQDAKLADSCSMVAASPAEKLLDVTEIRSENDLYTAMNRSHEEIPDSQWIHIDAALQLLHHYPNSPHRTEAHYKLGFASYGLFFKANDQPINGVEPLKLLRAAKENYEAVIEASPSAEIASDATYRLGIVHQRMSRYGIDRLEREKAINLIDEAGKIKGSLSDEQEMNRLAFMFEIAKTRLNKLPDVRKAMEDFINQRGSVSTKGTATVTLMLIEIVVDEVVGGREDNKELIRWYQRLKDFETSQEARPARYLGMFVMATLYYRDHLNDRAACLPIFQEIAKDCRDEEVVGPAVPSTRMMAQLEMAVSLLKVGRPQEAKTAIEQHIAEYGEKRHPATDWAVKEIEEALATEVQK